MTRYGWIWYDAKEIFEFSQENMDAKVKRYADVGINILIGFSCTHFRWSFVRHWDKINACIEKLVRACHKYGIKYVEHHSSHLTFNPQNDEDRKWAGKVLLSRNSKPEDWPGFWEDACGDPVIDGVKMSSMRQISGRSGKAGITTYHGYGMCFNNPDYRRLYLNYLESLYRLGIDGIMTDDIQFFGNDGTGWASFNACTCEHCRRLFREKTGYGIPQPEQWKEFYWNFKDRVFVAWKRFKDESTLDFAYTVNRHFENLGYHMLRPNYISNVIETNVTACPFEKCAELWDCVFQENCNFLIITQSWPAFALEAVHRLCMARKRGVPSMSMFYPCTDSAVYFGWAIAASWGQLFAQSGGENFDNYLDESFIRGFEDQNPELFQHPKKIADLAFLMSQNTRDYADGCQEYMKKYLKWMQASVMSGISTDMVFEDDGGDFGNYKILVAAYAAMLSDKTLKDLEQYVGGGGKLVIIGDFGIFKPDGSRRDKPALCANQKLGSGEVVVLNPSECADVYQDVMRVPRGNNLTERRNVAPYVIDQLRETGGKALRGQLEKTVYEIESDTELFAGLFENESCRTLHLVNIDGMVKKDGDCGHLDTVEAFCPGAPKTGEVRVKINAIKKAESVTLYSPENQSPLPLKFISENGRLEFTIPEGSFAGYCAVKID